MNTNKDMEGVLPLAGFLNLITQIFYVAFEKEKQ